MVELKQYYELVDLQWDEERDLAQRDVWVMNQKDCVPAQYPFDQWCGFFVAGQHAWPYGCSALSIPRSRGGDLRLKATWWYIAVSVPSEEDQKQRELVFRERIAPWVDDFEREWRGKFVKELTGLFEHLKNVDVKQLSDLDLWIHFREWVVALYRVWEIHMVGLCAGNSIWMLFDEMAKELIGMERNSPEMKMLMSGFDNRSFEVDAALWRLGQRADELGLGRLFQTTKDDEGLLAELGQSEAGKTWLGEFNEFLQENGWRTERIHQVCSRASWIENPSLAIPDVRRAISMGGAFVLKEERERLARERAELEKDVLSRLPQDKREWFEKLMRGAQWCGIFSEEHSFYTEFWFNALGRRVLHEIGNRFTRWGVIEDPEDMKFFARPDEVEWLMGPRANWSKMIRERKKQYEDFVKIIPPTPELPYFIGDPGKLPQLLGDPIMQVVSPMPLVRPELKADLYGSSSSLGVVEGTARVIFNERQIDQIQPGEILVTPATTPFWTPLFGYVKAVVTDGGGVLGHATIIGREYGIPAVSGTTEATTKIKTGDTIKVDGDNCCVYILKKAGEG